MSKSEPLSPQLMALKTTDLSPLVGMGGMMAPRVLKGFAASLDEKQKGAFEKVMPVGGEKQFYLHLTDTPTPPIVIGMAQPIKMRTESEIKVKERQIKGIRLTTDDVQLLSGGLTLGAALRLLWRFKGQLFTMLFLVSILMPFLMLGPGRLKDMGNKATSHFKPLLDLMPRP